MKIIDLLNKIANVEEVPKKIKYDGTIYEYNERADFYYWKESSLYREFATNGNCLDKEVEIIEEPKKIEKLDVALLGQCDNWLRCPTNKVTKQDVELNPYIIDNIRENTLYFQRKINELIDEINNLKEK